MDDKEGIVVVKVSSHLQHILVYIAAISMRTSVQFEVAVLDAAATCERIYNLHSEFSNEL